ncbi:MAG: endonuclease/exonuclease/phosphatase family protein [Azonexus sp.]|nr:endonuclease/exonuclease/phosphatase family protein [Azonexus sp.]
MKRLAPHVLNATTSTLVAALLAGLLGQWLRDRTLATALMMYVPLLPLGLAAIVYDAARRGHAIGRMRFALAGIGALAAMLAVADMTGTPLQTGTVALQTPIRLMHWNVWWGGPPGRRDDQHWNVMINRIRSHGPDIVVLSEAPGKPKLGRLTGAMGPGWTFVNRRQDNEGGADRVAVLSRWPVDKEKTFDFHNGGAMIARIDRPHAPPLRIFAVDGLSHVLILRTALLDDVAQTCRRLESAGVRIDLIVGDFNATARSIGFDQFATMCGGYHLASRGASEWRATYRAGLPLYDIDHVWLHDSLALQGCEFFTDLTSNHRGQIVSFGIGQ